MPIVGCAIVPNSPLLLPGLSAEARKASAKITQAMERVAVELYARQPSVCLLIAESADFKQPTLLQGDKLQYRFDELGDFSTQGQVQGAVGFVHRLKERYETAFPMPLSTPPWLPASAAIPAVRMAPLFDSCSTAVLMLPQRTSPDEIERLGNVLQGELAVCQERVVLMACGTLAVHSARHLGDAKVYDASFLNGLRSADASGLLNLDNEVRSRVRDTLWAPTCVARLSLGERTCACEVIEYGVPVGVGFVVAARYHS